MELKQPNSMEELVYFTNRAIGAKGGARMWIFKEKCPKCKKGIMGKPVDNKGHVKIRAKEYQCPECKIIMQKDEYEDTLIANAEYTCPSCEFKGGAQVPFKRKKVKGVELIRVQCEKCKANIDITKKMKEKAHD